MRMNCDGNCDMLMRMMTIQIREAAKTKSRLFAHNHRDLFTSICQVLSEVEEEQDSSGRESEEGPLIYPDFEYEVTLTPLIYLKI